MGNRKLILFISMSVDGFLAGLDDDISWLSTVEKEGEDYGYKKFTDTVDTYLVGRKTYDVVTKLTGGTFPPASQFKCFILSRNKSGEENGVTFYNGDAITLVKQLKEEKGKNIYCDGGGQIVQLLMKGNLIDEYIISIIPVMLGDGKRLFLGGTSFQNLVLKPAKYFDTGLVQAHYVKK